MVFPEALGGRLPEVNTKRCRATGRRTATHVVSRSHSHRVQVPQKRETFECSLSVRVLVRACSESVFMRVPVVPCVCGLGCACPCARGETDSAPITKEVTGAERQERLEHLQQLL